MDIVLFVLAYLMGSCPSAALTCRLLNLPDPRQQGSKNPGATNVLRIGGKKAGAITLVCDISKGLIPVVIAQQTAMPATTLGLVGLSALLGHLFPLFSGFKGGKGVATYFGALWGLSPQLGIIATATWLLLAAIFRYASLSSIAATIVAAIASLWLGPSSLALIIMAALISWRHHENIKRLLAGQENKINFSKK